MPPLGSIRLGAFCDLIGQPRETVRTAIYAERFPVREWQGEGQRTFDGRDVFAFEVFLALTGDGAEHERAAEAVNMSRAAEDFLDAIDRGDGARDLCLVADAFAERDPLTGFAEVRGAFTARAAELGEYIAARIDPRPSFRRPGRDSDTQPLGLRRVNVVPLWPCWQMARDRAEAAGYRLYGRHLTTATTDPEASQ